jgi:methyl-accepting chemotaxis protein
VLALLALLPVLGLYLVPRVVDLVATPYRLVDSTDHAASYNDGLGTIVKHERDTLAALDAIDRIDGSLDDVRITDADVATELDTLVAQIRADLQPVLDDADANVSALSAALRALDTSIEGLNSPVGSADLALRANRATLQQLLAQARRTAAEVRAASESAEGSADNMDGGRK